MLLKKLKVDDVVDAFPVHGACGIWGTIAWPVPRSFRFFAFFLLFTFFVFFVFRARAGGGGGDVFGELSKCGCGNLLFRCQGLGHGDMSSTTLLESPAVAFMLEFWAHTAAAYQV